MKIHFAVGLASLVAFSCGGGSGSKGAAAPSSSAGGTSQLSITTLASDGSAASSKFAISGPTYGVFDSASGAFHIFIVDGAGGPTPDCDHLKDLASGQAKARIVDIYLDKNVTAAGKFAAAGALAIDATGAAPSMNQGNVDGVALDFKSIDAKSFDANVVSASGSATGSLHGTICDGSKLRGPSNGAMTVTVGNAAPNDEPQTKGATEFAIEVETSPGSRNTTAVAGSSMAKLDPKTKILAIATWPDPSFFKEDPPAAKPSCDVFTDGKKVLGKRGSVTILYTKSGKHAAGKYDVYAVQSFAIMPEVTDNMDGGGTVVASVDVSKFDDKDFTAHYVSTAKLNDEKETIGGTVCPNGHVEAPLPPKASKPAPGTKKK